MGSIPASRASLADRQASTPKELAFEPALSHKTVNVHRMRIMERLDLHDIASLTVYAARKGLIDM